MAPLFQVLYEDADLLVVNKPADLVCHPTKADAYSSLIGRVRLYLAANATNARRSRGESEEAARQRSDLPRFAATRPHLINRLDRETSGVTLVALRDDTARQLRSLWEDRQVEKEYAAIVHGHLKADHGSIKVPLGKDERSRVAIKDCARPDGRPAETEYWVEQRFVREEGQFSLLKVLPRTGRKHQIRIHLAFIGHPIVGDKLYGCDEDLYLALVERRLTPAQRQALILPYHALHAQEVRFTWRGRQLTFRAEPEPWFSGFLRGTP